MVGWNQHFFRVVFNINFEICSELFEIAITASSSKRLTGKLINIIAIIIGYYMESATYTQLYFYMLFALPTSECQTLSAREYMHNSHFSCNFLQILIITRIRIIYSLTFLNKNKIMFKTINDLDNWNFFIYLLY